MILITSFLFHYLTAIIIPAILIIFFLNFYDDSYLIGIKKSVIKYLKYSMSFLLPGIMFVALFFLQEKSILHLNSHKVNSSVSATPKVKASSVSKDTAAIKQPIGQESTVAHKEEKGSSIYSIVKEKSTVIVNAWRLSKSKVIGFLSLLKHFLQDYSSGMSIFKLFLLAASTSWILLFLVFFTRWKREAVIVLSISFIIYIMAFNSSFNIALYGKTMRFFTSILAFGLLVNVLFDKIKTSPLLSGFAIAGLGLLTSQTLPLLYYEYYNTKQYSTLTQADLDAYEYIDEHLAEEKSYFIPVNASDLVFKNTIPFDGYLYLDLSKAKLAVAFVLNEEPEFSRLEAASFKISLARWIGKDPRAEVVYNRIKKRDKYFEIKSLFDKMRDLNIKYVYSGAHSAWNRLVSIERLKNEGCLELIYDKKGARIFKLVDE